MSIATHLTNIEANRNKIRDKLIDLGLATSADKLDALAVAIENMANHGAVSVEILEGSTYTIPAGYHNGSGVVQAKTDVQGDYTRYKTQHKDITPTKQQQSVAPDTGYYALESVTVAPIPDAYQNVSSVTATAGDVLTGKIYVDKDGTIITGTMTNNGKVTVVIDAMTTSYTIPKGYHDGTGTVSVAGQIKMATPTKASQMINPDSGKVLRSVTVNPIPGEYQDVTPVTAAAADVLTGKKIVDASGAVVTGTMPYGDRHITFEKEDFDAVNSEEGYYGALYKQVPKGYYTGEENGEGQMAIPLKEITHTPTKTAVTYDAIDNEISEGDERYVPFSKVTINPIPDAYQDVTEVNAIAGNVLTGKKIVNASGEVVTGTMPNRGKVTEKLDTATTSYTIPSGYHTGFGTVSIELEAKTATPTKKAQNILASVGKVINKVIVNPIPDAYQDVTAVTAQASEVLAGEKIVGADGTVITGTMANNGSQTKTINGLVTTSVTIPAGYTTGGTVSLTDDIEIALAAI